MTCCGPSMTPQPWYRHDQLCQHYRTAGRLACSCGPHCGCFACTVQGGADIVHHGPGSLGPGPATPAESADADGQPDANQEATHNDR